MYCPECGGEYRPEITLCPTCEVALTDTLERAGGRRLQPRMVPTLVDLVGFIDEREARDARQRLKDAKIPCELVIRDAEGSNGEGEGGVGDEFWIRVKGTVVEAAADTLGLELALSDDNCYSCGAPLDESDTCGRCGATRPKE